MPWFPNPAGGAPIQADTNPNPAGGSYGYYSDPSYSGPPPSTGGSPSTPTGPTTTVAPQQQVDQGAGLSALLAAAQRGDKETFEKTLNEQIREFDQKYGLDLQQFGEYVRQYNQNFGISEAGLTGTYKGAPTLQAQNQYFQQGLAGITTAAGLQANPFRQQQVLGQLSGLYSGQGVAGFQMPNTVAGVGTQGGNQRGGLGYMEQMIQDIRDPTPNQTSMRQVLDATPTPNKLNSVDFLRAAPSTQSMVLQAMQEKFGIDPNDALTQIKNTLPQFQAPSTVGQVRR